VLLVNPHGNRKGSEAAKSWLTETRRHAKGWSVSVVVGLGTDLHSVGLSVHRFYRGVNNEVHGLGDWLPYPLDPSRFAVVVLGGQEAAGLVANRHRESALAAAWRTREALLTAARERIAAAQKKGGPTPSLELAVEFARERACAAVLADEGFLCWNEAYYQLALVDLWELTGDRRWLETAALRMEEVWALRADRRGIRDSMWGRPLPTWYNDSETGTACTLVSGTIIHPIARFLRTVRDAPGLADLWRQVKAWISLCEEVIALHDPEWVELPDGSGVHLEPYQKGPRRVYPKGGSRINPLNRQHALGVPMLYLGRLLKKDDYLRKVTMMARFFRKSCDLADDCLVWEYSAGPYPADGEDIDHAHIQVRFAELCAREGIVFTEGDLRMIAATLERDIFRYGDVPCGTVRGYGPGLHFGLGTWTSLCRFVPHVFPKIVAVVETLLREGRASFLNQGWGIRNLTCIEKARRMLSD
jgi:hypothetical protein